MDCGFVSGSEGVSASRRRGRTPETISGLTVFRYHVESGGGEIRTHEPLSWPTVFKTVAIDHSATPPLLHVISRCLFIRHSLGEGGQPFPPKADRRPPLQICLQ